LDLSRSAEEVHDHVRALSPDPGVVTTMNGLEVKVLRSWPTATVGVPEDARAVSGRSGEPAVVGERLFLGCGSGAVELLVVQPTGKRAMSAPEFLRGYGSRLR